MIGPEDVDIADQLVEVSLDVAKSRAATKRPAGARCKRALANLLRLALLVALVCWALPLQLGGYVASLSAALLTAKLLDSSFLPVIYPLYNTWAGKVREWAMRRVQMNRCCGRNGMQHSLPSATTLNGPAGTPAVTVHSIACLLDNYAYLIVDRRSAAAVDGGRMQFACAIVDATDHETVLAALETVERVYYGGEGSLRPVALLSTHKHWDHCAGNAELMRRIPTIERCCGGRLDFADDGDGRAVNELLDDGDTVELSIGSNAPLVIEALHTPCHTVGHTAFLLHATGWRQSAIFSGDALFCCGCGVPFEGTDAQQAATMRHIYLRALRTGASTLLFPGHEYTLPLLEARLSFLLFDIEDGGILTKPPCPSALPQLAALALSTREKRAAGAPTVPSLLDKEVIVNESFDHLHQAALVIQRRLRRRKHMRDWATATAHSSSSR